MIFRILMIYINPIPSWETGCMWPTGTVWAYNQFCHFEHLYKDSNIFSYFIPLNVVDYIQKTVLIYGKTAIVLFQRPKVSFKINKYLLNNHYATIKPGFINPYILMNTNKIKYTNTINMLKKRVLFKKFIFRLGLIFLPDSKNIYLYQWVYFWVGGCWLSETKANSVQLS